MAENILMTNPIALLIMVALGGALGGAARYAISNTIGSRFGHPAWGIFAVNISGALIVGIFAALLLDPQSRLAQDSVVWLVLAVGLVGSYTTVSSFALQTLAMLHSRKFGPAAANVFGTLFASLGACALGFWLTGALI